MKQILTVFVCATLCMSLCVPAFAADSPAHTKIVYLLDASNSMNSNDPQRLAVDAIKQMALSAPSNADLGFVAFNDGVTASVPLTGTSGREKLVAAAPHVSCIGYTDVVSAKGENRCSN